MYSLREMCQVLNLDTNLTDKNITKVCFMESQIILNCAYFCIKGETFDSHNVDKEKLIKNSVTMFTDKPIEGINCVYTDNPLEAYEKLASLRKTDFAVHSVAITGSIGKTSQKDMLYATLSANGQTLRTSGSSNSKLAGAEVILRFNRNTKYAVYEMGLRRPNQLFERYSELIQPEVCVITNIGNSHIENFRDKNHILDEKLYITSGMNPEGILIINADDETLLGRAYGFKTITFAIGNKMADYVANDIITFNDSIEFNAVFDGGTLPIKLNVPGKHNILNALACIAVGKLFGLTHQQIVTGLANFKTSGYRQNVITGYKDNPLILDCVNATPESMESAFEMLKDMNVEDGSRRIAILGHMMRLGRLSEELHREVGRKLAKYDFDLIVTYSGHSEYITEELKVRNIKAVHFYSKKETVEFLRDFIKPKDALLFKGVGKFCNFIELYNGLIGDIDFPLCNYYGFFAHDTTMHTDAKAYAIIDCDTKTILAGKNINQRLEVASLVMILSVITALENGSSNDIVTISSNAVKSSKNCSRVGHAVGERYELSDLLKSSLLLSAFDSMTAVAEHIGKDVRSFVKMMNLLALKIGMRNTYFSNPVGRPDPSGYSTAEDMAALVAYAINNPAFERIMLLKDCIITELNSNTKREIKTTIPLLVHAKKDEYLDYYYDQAIGIKAGKNSNAQQCVATCTKCGNSYVSVIILGAEDYEYNKFSFLDAARMLHITCQKLQGSMKS